LIYSITKFNDVLYTEKHSTAVSPIKKEFLLKSKVELRCTMYENSFWTYKGGKLPYNARVEKDDTTKVMTLIINNANQLNQGTYECTQKINDLYYKRGYTRMSMSKELLRHWQ